mgnify:CR=1 FL=1
MYHINHLPQNNSGQDTVHSQFIKIARILVSFIAIAIFIVTGWLVTRDEKFLLSDSVFIIASEALVAITVFAILIWKGTRIIESACIQRDKAINALKEKEARFRSFVDTSLIGIIEANTDGNIYVANDEFLRITGYTHSCLKAGKLNWFDITPSEYKDIDRQNFSQAKAGVNCAPYEKRLICADGTQVKVKVCCNYLEENAKSNTYIINVTKCNQDEQNPSSQEHWLEHLLDMMPVPLLLIEPGTARVNFANKAAKEIAGGEFPLAKSLAEYSELYCFTNESGKIIDSELTPPARVALGERLEGVEINWHRGDNIYPIRVFADTLPPMYGYPATCIALFQDVTKLKQLEKSLRLGDERLKLVFETTNDLISSEQPEDLIKNLYSEIADKLNLDCYFYHLVDKKSQVMRLASSSGITCSQAKEFERQEFSQGICGIVAMKGSAMNIQNLQQSNQPETELIRNNGILAYYCCPLIAQGQLLGTISFGSRTSSGFNSYEVDIMQAVCNQIAIAIQRANLMNSLQQANRIKDEFLGILSHELRSPLNSILGWAQYLQVRKLDENTTSRALESIERNSRELHNIIEELLDMSRTIQGKMQLNIRNCNLAPIIAAVIENLHSTSIAKQIEIKLSVIRGCEIDEDKEPLNPPSLNTIPNSQEPIHQDDNFLVAGDSQRLRQVIWNLLSNAIKFTSCGGSIEVRLSEEKINETSLSYAVIQVSDTGIGINSEFLPYVFDRFRQGDSSNARAHNGLGLGLAIVRHIVELHGGNIGVESPGEGKGSTFTVKLPLLESTNSESGKKKFEGKFAVIN